MSRTSRSKATKSSKSAKRDDSFYPRLPGFAVSEGLVPLSNSRMDPAVAYTYEVPYAPFLSTVGVGTFRFSFRHLPYDSLSGFHQDYWDWLSSLSTLMQKAPTEKVYKHGHNVLFDTIGSMEAFILAAMSRIPVNDTDTIQKITTSGMFQMAGQYAAFISPDLHPYIFRLGWTWPAMAKPKYLTVVNDGDTAVIDAIVRMRESIIGHANSLPNNLTNAMVDELDRYVPAVQEALLLGLLARLQFNHQVAVNVASTLLASDVDLVLQWRKRFQLLSAELLTYLQRSRYSNKAETLMPLTTPPNGAAVPIMRTNPIWLPTGEIDYSPLIRRPSAFSLRGSQYAVVPIMSGSTEIKVPATSMDAVTPLPSGTIIRPAESAAGLIAPSGVWQPTYVSSTGQYQQGRPMVAPRVAFVSGDQATLLGGKSAGHNEPKLFGFDPHAGTAVPPKKKTGGCTP
jgi:hypothetical protein